MTQVFLVNQNAGSTFPDPGNWNPSSNTVEVVGSGGYGQACTTGSGCTQPPCLASVPPLRGRHPWTKEELAWLPPTDPNHPQVGSITGSGAGGGGGSYGRGVNVSPTFPWPYYIQGTVASSGGAHYWSTWGSGSATSATPPQNAGWVYAAAGCDGQGGSSGGPAGWPNGVAGGNGGTGTAAVGYNGGGGGGAAGPHGAGSAGAQGTAVASSGGGGAADGGTVAGAAAGANANSSTYWDASHGVSSGSGGGTPTHLNGGTAANYGGGAGGGSSSGAGGAATPGGASIIILTYTPFVPSALAVIMA